MLIFYNVSYVPILVLISALGIPLTEGLIRSKEHTILQSEKDIKIMTVSMCKLEKIYDISELNRTEAHKMYL